MRDPRNDLAIANLPGDVCFLFDCTCLCDVALILRYFEFEFAWNVDFFKKNVFSFTSLRSFDNTYSI